MTTQELVKETEAEFFAGIDHTAKNFNYLVDEVNRLRAEIKVLQDANLTLRAKALELSKWSADMTDKCLPKTKMPEPIEFPSGVYDDP